MKRKIFSKLLMVAMLIASVSTFVSCKDYDDDINNLRSLNDQNAKLIEQLKTQITAGALITGVTSTTDGVDVTLNNGQTFHLKNGTNGTNGVDGKDGKDGVDGKDAIAWTIGEDGYWYMDGVKTDFYALGKDGKDGAPGKDGVDGKDGKDGVDGKDGKDAVVWTIGDDGYWYKDGVKTDNKAIGIDGVNGKDGKDGVDGKDGKDGVDGKDGKDGVDGKDGKDGKDGVDGKDGKDGKDAFPGKYYVPNAETGCFDVYEWDPTLSDGKGGYVATATEIPYTSPTALTATLGKNALVLHNVETADGLQDFTIFLTNRLRGLVFAGDYFDADEENKDEQIKRAYLDGVPAIRVKMFDFSELHKMLWGDAKKDSTDSKGELWTMTLDKNGNPVMTDTINVPTYAYYHVNPSNAKIEDLQDLRYVIKANSEYIVTRSKASDDFNVTPEFVSFEDGILKVKLTIEGTPAASHRINNTVGRITDISAIALQASAKGVEEDTVITSDYTAVYKQNIENLIISDNSSVLSDNGETFVNKGDEGNGDAWYDYHFRQGDNVNSYAAGYGLTHFTINSGWNSTYDQTLDKNWWKWDYRAGTNMWAVWDEYTFNHGEGNDPTVDFKLQYNETHNLYDYVTVHETGSISPSTRSTIYGDTPDLHDNCSGKTLLDQLGLELKFEIVKNYKLPYANTPQGLANLTDQAQFIALDENGNIHAQVYGNDYQGNPTAAIGRTPIIRVKLVQKETGKIVRVSFVKIQWVKKAVPDKYIELQLKDAKWDCNGVWDSTTVQKINEEIYQYLGMSKEEFHTAYPIFQDNWVEGDNGGENLRNDAFAPSQPTQDYIWGNTNEAHGKYTKKYQVATDKANWVNQAQIVSNETGGNSTYMIYWQIPADTLWKYAGQRIQNVVTFYGAGNKVAIKLLANVQGIDKEYNLTTADYRPNYWINNFASTEFNVNVPNRSTWLDEDTCIYKNNLNHPFITNTDGVIKLHKDDVTLKVAKMYYFFCKDMESGEKTIGGTKVTFKILANDPLDTDTLLAREKANQNWSVIGYIQNSVVGTATVPGEQFEDPVDAKQIWNLFEYNKYAFEENDDPLHQYDRVIHNYGSETDATKAINVTEDPTLAKKLLNTGAMNVLIGAKALICQPTVEDGGFEVKVTFNGADHFQADIVKPVYGESAGGTVYDAVNFPINDAKTKKSYIRLEDIVKFYEWRYKYNSVAEYAFTWWTYGAKGGDGADKNDIVVKKPGSWHWSYYGLCDDEYDFIKSGNSWIDRYNDKAFEIEVKPSEVKCNIDGPGTNVDLPAGLYVGFDKTVVGAIDQATVIENTAVPYVMITDPSDATPVAEADGGKVYTNYGVLTYHNTGNVLQSDLELYVPVHVKYGWGEFTVTVVVTVKKTGDA